MCRSRSTSAPSWHCSWLKVSGTLDVVLNNSSVLSLMDLVAVEMESSVVQLMVEQVCVAMAMHSREAGVILWATKALANASPNGKTTRVVWSPRYDHSLGNCS